MKQIDGEFGTAAEILNNTSEVEEEGSNEAE